MNTQPEYIIKIGAEGGSLCVSRYREWDSWHFAFHHSEFDPTEEVGGIEYEESSQSFYSVFAKIDRYPWHMLYLEYVHPDYVGWLREALVEKLNRTETPADDFYSADQYVRLLSIQLTCSEGRWSHSVDRNAPMNEFV